MQASVPFRSEQVDRDGFSVIVGLLAFYYDSRRIDSLRALRRSNVDTYLMSRSRPNRRTLRYLLYAASRVWYRQHRLSMLRARFALLRPHLRRSPPCTVWP